MARLLVDMNLSTEWIPLLQAAGHTAVHLSEVGDPRAPDAALMQWALVNDYAVFTHDLDFGTMLALSGDNFPDGGGAPVCGRSAASTCCQKQSGLWCSHCFGSMPTKSTEELWLWLMNAVHEYASSR